MSIVHCKQDYFNNCFSSFWISYEMCKINAYFKYLYGSQKTIKFLIQNIWPVKYT